MGITVANTVPGELTYIKATELLKKKRKKKEENVKARKSKFKHLIGRKPSMFKDIRKIGI